MTSVALTTNTGTKLPAPLAQVIVSALPNVTAILGDESLGRRILQETVVAIQRNPKLLEADPESLMLAVTTVAQWGLSIGTTAHLVPFFNKREMRTLVTPIADYKGLAELVYASTRYVIEARAVYEGERFEVHYGTNAGIDHLPDFGKRGSFAKITHVYAIARKGRDSKFEVMTRAEVEQRRSVSRNKDGDTWTKWYEGMAKKTVVRALCKTLPQNPRLAMLIASDEREDLPADEPMLEIPAELTGPVNPPVRPPMTPPKNGVDYPAGTTHNLRTGEIVEPADEDAPDGLFEDGDDLLPVPSLPEALAYIMPGAATSWGGFGGKPFGECRNHVLEALVKWSREKMEEKGVSADNFDRHVERIAHANVVLDARRSGLIAQPARREEAA